MRTKLVEIEDLANQYLESSAGKHMIASCVAKLASGWLIPKSSVTKGLPDERFFLGDEDVSVRIDMLSVRTLI